jgi:hypothetical protein
MQVKLCNHKALDWRGLWVNAARKLTHKVNRPGPDLCHHCTCWVGYEGASVERDLA